MASLSSGVNEHPRRASNSRSRQGVDVLGVEHQAVHIEGDCEHGEGGMKDEGLRAEDKD